MIPQEFDYSAPTSLKEALQLIADGERKVMAGGRLAAPGHVVDIARVPDLNHITESGGVVHIGATATHHDLESSPVIRGRCPLLAEAASHIGDTQVRNMGTIGGSIAHADPAADYPASLLALEARIRLVSAKSDRTVAASEFFLDPFTTAVEPGEMVLEVLVNNEEPSEGYRYEKVAHPASGFAVVGIAARIKKTGGKISLARIGMTGMAPRAFRAVAAEKLLESGAGIEKAAAAVADGQDANSDLYASAGYRRHLARVWAARAMTVALSRAS